MKRYHLITCLTLLMIAMQPAAEAFAQACDNSICVRVQESHKVDSAAIEQQILAGCDPCPNWIPHGGARWGTPEGASTVTNVSKSNNECPPTLKLDDTCEVEYPECAGRPGGMSVNGALDDCRKGRGLPTAGLAGIGLSLFPGFPFGFAECLMNMLNSLDFSSVGSFAGSFVNNVTVSGSASASMSGACAGGSVGLCGFSLGGELCTTLPLGAAADAVESMVSIIGGADIMFNSVMDPDLNGAFEPIQIVNGGGTLTLPDGSMTQVADGQQFFLQNNTLYQSDSSVTDVGGMTPVYNFDPNNTNEQVTLTANDQANIPASLVSLPADG